MPTTVIKVAKLPNTLLAEELEDVVQEFCINKALSMPDSVKTSPVIGTAFATGLVEFWFKELGEVLICVDEGCAWDFCRRSMAILTGEEA